MIKFCNIAIKSIVWGKQKLSQYAKNKVYSYKINIDCRFPVVDGVTANINTSLWDLGFRVPPQNSSTVLSMDVFPDPLVWSRGLHHIISLKPNKYNKTNVVTLLLTSTSKLDIVEPILVIGEEQPYELKRVTIKCEEI